MSKLPKDVLAEILEVKQKAPPAADDLLYSWLRSVYVCGGRIESRGQSNARAITRELCRRHKIRSSPNLYRVLVHATADQDAHVKMRNKYGIVLNWCRQRGVSPLALRSFIKRHGGLNGCVKKARGAAGEGT